MIINFDKMDEQLVPNPRGGEGQMRKRAFQNEDVQIMHLTLAPRSAIGVHAHVDDSEMYYIISGTGRVIYDGGELPVQSGSCHYCPRGHEHSLVNDSDEDMVILAVIPAAR